MEQRQRGVMLRHEQHHHDRDELEDIPEESDAIPQVRKWRQECWQEGVERQEIDTEQGGQ